MATMNPVYKIYVSFLSWACRRELQRLSKHYFVMNPRVMVGPRLTRQDLIRYHEQVAVAAMKSRGDRFTAMVAAVSHDTIHLLKGGH